MISGRNLWERDRLRKLKSVADVDAEIERCEKGQKGAQSVAVLKEWHRKLVFLDRLKLELGRTEVTKGTKGKYPAHRLNHDVMEERA